MYVALALLVCFVVGSALAWMVARRARGREAEPAVPGLRLDEKVDEGPTIARYAPRVLLLVGDEHAALVQAATALPCVRIANAAQLVEEAAHWHAAVAIVDVDLLPQLQGYAEDAPLVGLIDVAAEETLRSVVRALQEAPALASVLVASTLGTPDGRKHLAHLLRRLTSDPSHDLLGASSTGRTAKLAQASHRAARFERMADFFAEHGVSRGTVGAIQSVAEALVMNALYDAPAVAGFFAEPVSRSVDVTLPARRACEISYGMDGDDAFVRVRDSFGSLERSRLLGEPGLWRALSAATAVVVTVVPDRLTDIVVRIAAKGARASRPLMAVHLFVQPRRDDDLFALDRQSSLVDRSITLIQA